MGRVSACGKSSWNFVMLRRLSRSGLTLSAPARCMSRMSKAKCEHTKYRSQTRDMIDGFLDVPLFTEWTIPKLLHSMSTHLVENLCPHSWHETTMASSSRHAMGCFRWAALKGEDQQLLWRTPPIPRLLASVANDSTWEEVHPS